MTLITTLPSVILAPSIENLSDRHDIQCCLRTFLSPLLISYLTITSLIWRNFKRLSTYKGEALGPDGLSYQIIRHFHPSALSFLLTLFNHIWVESIFPPYWQQVLIVPILKPGKDPHLATNHRPIALRCQPYKLIERMIANHLFPELEERRTFSSF